MVANNNHPGLLFGVQIIPRGGHLLVHYDPQWAASWLGGKLEGSSPTSPYTHHGTGQKEMVPVGGKNLREGENGQREGHFGGLNNIFLCTVFLLQIGLEAQLSLGPDSGLLLNTNRKQQHSKGGTLYEESIFLLPFPLSPPPCTFPPAFCPSTHSWVSLGMTSRLHETEGRSRTLFGT